MKVVVQRVLKDEGDCPVPAQAEFNRWARAIDRSAREVCVRIVDNREAQALNRRYRGHSRVPNVLAFPFVSPAPEPDNYLGDVVLAARRVIDEARRGGITFTNHWAHLFVHGVLHLQGYGHCSEAQASRMESREIAILKKLDIPSPYADQAASIDE